MAKRIKKTPNVLRKSTKTQSLSPKLEELKDELIQRLGSLLHEEWRVSRKKEDGTFEPRIKTTKDEAWIALHDASEVDIANTLYVDLPQDRQYENKASAQVAIQAIYQANQEGKLLDDAFIEATSDVIHQERLKRNAWVYDATYGNPILTKPYADLPEDEKAKDRIIVYRAIEIYYDLLSKSKR